MKISNAKLEGQEWVETDPQILAYYNRKGLGTNTLNGKENRHFTYKGIKVCAYGQQESIEKELDEQIAVRMHGPQEGVLLGRTGG